MEVWWKVGGAALLGVAAGALLATLGRSGATATQPRTRIRRKKFSHADFDLEYEIHGDKNPRVVTSAVSLKPIKGGWAGPAGRFKAKLIER